MHKTQEGYYIFIIERLFDSFSSLDHNLRKTYRIILIRRINSLILQLRSNRNSSFHSLLHLDEIESKIFLLFFFDSCQKGVEGHIFFLMKSAFIFMLFYFVLYNSFVCGIIFSREVMKRIIEWISTYA